jgi:hypothetical protein
LRAFLADHPGAASLGVLLYTGDSAIPLGDRVVAIPLSSMLAGTQGDG